MTRDERIEGYAISAVCNALSLHMTRPPSCAVM